MHRLPNIKPNDVMYPLNNLIEKYGLIEYIRDYYSAVNGYLNMLYTENNFYIAEDMTYQPWLSIMGIIPESLSDNTFSELLEKYLNDNKYIAVCTNIKEVSDLLQKMPSYTYHEDFFVACLPKPDDVDNCDIRPATVDDLPFIESTYSRSGHKQLLSRINARQMWVSASENQIKGYIGIHKDCSLGFEYVDCKFRRQRIGTKLQNFVANHMIENGMLPYVMISENNTAGKNLQMRFGAKFAKEKCYFFAKGAYEFE